MRRPLPLSHAFRRYSGRRALATLVVAGACAFPGGVEGQATRPATARAAADSSARTAKGSGEPWQIIPMMEASLVFARDGSLLGEIGRELRSLVSIRTLPRYVPLAFVAVEDQRFYQHDGVDLVGVAGALKDALRGEPRGASTITQQLVGNMHPDVIDRSDKSIGRKLREQAAAREMEKRYSKEEILEAYLNYIHFGHRWYGIESAARHYFGKPASRLTIAEAATLASIPKGPGIYDPLRFPDRVRERRNVVLTLMQGQGYITAAQANAAKREPVATVKDGGFAVRAPWFLDVVRVQAERNGVKLIDGGYRVQTTLDPVVQRAATEALQAEALELERREGYGHPTFEKRRRGVSDYLQGAVVALDPFTGDVRALVGGRDYAESPFNRAVNGVRQPGSAFKPIVYATAIADSIPPNEIIPDTAIAIPLPNRTVYRPENSDGGYLGPITMREALARSRNVVAVQIGERVGIDRVTATARALGITSFIAPYPSSAIGASAVQPLDLVAAYATFANLGARVEARFVTRIEDAAGREVWQNPTVTPRLAMDPKVAFIVRDMMRDVVERGTASSIRRFVPPSIPVAGKTGTTNDNADVWFVGMTPDVVAGVWLGFDKPRTITPGAAGGSLAAPVFGRMVQAAGLGRGAGAWQPPEGLVIAELDRLTGELATAQTPPERRYTEYFLPGTEPAFLRMDAWKVLVAAPIY